jgi:hypothetical protein
MPSLQRFASHHCWYYFVRCKNLSDEDMALLSWAKSTVGCPWNTCVLNANALADGRCAHVCRGGKTAGDPAASGLTKISLAQVPWDIFGESQPHEGSRYINSL